MASGRGGAGASAAGRFCGGTAGEGPPPTAAASRARSAAAARAASEWASTSLSSLQRPWLCRRTRRYAVPPASRGGSGRLPATAGVALAASAVARTAARLGRAFLLRRRRGHCSLPPPRPCLPVPADFTPSTFHQPPSAVPELVAPPHGHVVHLRPGEDAHRPRFLGRRRRRGGLPPSAFCCTDLRKSMNPFPFSFTRARASVGRLLLVPLPLVRRANNSCGRAPSVAVCVSSSGLRITSLIVAHLRGQRHLLRLRGSDQERDRPRLDRLGLRRPRLRRRPLR